MWGSGTVYPDVARERGFSSQYQRVQFHIWFRWLISLLVSTKTGQARPCLPGPNCYRVPPRLVGQAVSWICSLETNPCSEKWGTGCWGQGIWEGCSSFWAALQSAGNYLGVCWCSAWFSSLFPVSGPHTRVSVSDPSIKNACVSQLSWQIVRRTEKPIPFDGSQQLDQLNPLGGISASFWADYID